jgi:hypothetical protein
VGAGSASAAGAVTSALAGRAVAGSHFDDGDWLFGWFGWLDCESDERDEPSRC